MNSTNVSLYAKIVFELRFLSCGKYSERNLDMYFAKSVLVIIVLDFRINVGGNGRTQFT